MRDLFVKILLQVVRSPQDLQNLVDGITPGTWDKVPFNATLRSAGNLIVDLAIAGGWARELAEALARIAPRNGDLATLRAQLPSEPTPTVEDPFDEVLLEGDRPFANRRELRVQLKRLCTGDGTVLLVRGAPQTGKSFSFYLAQHGARRRGYITSRFEVVRYVQPDELAAEILERIGVDVPLREKGLESAARWAGDKLAAQVRSAIEERGLPRLFVFDEFPVAPLPPETVSFIARLAQYADEELRPWLRLLLIQFPGQLPGSLGQIAECEEAHPFTGTDMLFVLQQVAKARGWSVSDRALQAEILALDGQPAIKLRDRFLFLRRAIRQLASRGAP